MDAHTSATVESVQSSSQSTVAEGACDGDSDEHTTATGSCDEAPAQHAAVAIPAANDEELLTREEPRDNEVALPRPRPYGGKQ